MKEIIQLRNQKIGGAIINAINARELHLFLDSKQEFANWFKNRIDQYDFQENHDFIINDNYINNSSRRGLSLLNTLSASTWQKSCPWSNEMNVGNRPESTSSKSKRDSKPIRLSKPRHTPRLERCSRIRSGTLKAAFSLQKQRGYPEIKPF